MKRMVSALAALLLLLPSLLINTVAADNLSETDMIYLENGSYIRVEIFSADLRETGRKIGHKNYTYYNGEGEEKWSATLTGSFTYTGTSATCTSSSCSVALSDSHWSLVSKTTEKSGNTATATVIMENKLLGIVVDNAEVNIKLTCDGKGNLS